MPEPRTALDERFSDADIEPIPWSDTVRAIASAELFWVTTDRKSVV